MHVHQPGLLVWAVPMFAVGIIGFWTAPRRSKLDPRTWQDWRFLAFNVFFIVEGLFRFSQTFDFHHSLSQRTMVIAYVSEATLFLLLMTSIAVLFARKKDYADAELIPQVGQTEIQHDIWPPPPNNPIG